MGAIPSHIVSQWIMNLPKTKGAQVCGTFCESHITVGLDSRTKKKAVRQQLLSGRRSAQTPGMYWGFEEWRLFHWQTTTAPLSSEGKTFLLEGMWSSSWQVQGQIQLLYHTLQHFSINILPSQMSEDRDLVLVGLDKIGILDSQGQCNGNLLQDSKTSCLDIKSWISPI